MGFVGSTILPDSIIANEPLSVVQIINTELTTANTEYSIALPSSCRGFLIQCRQNFDIKLSFSPGTSSTNYISVKAGYSYSNDKKFSSITLYVQSPKAGAVVEVAVET